LWVLILIKFKGGIKMKAMKIVNKIALPLVVIGGINWGLTIFNLNLVEILSFGSVLAADIVYGAVAVSAILLIPEAINKLTK
jgi:uncharacterized membrane protein YuzA (DUF378 family)